jgi:hypothetical protein
MLAQERNPEPRLNCRRHAALVAAAIVGVVVARVMSLHAPIPWEFACYGGLHAAILALSLRPGPAHLRALACVAGAALLSFLLAGLGLRAVPFLAGGGMQRAALAVIATSAFAGALGYGALVRWITDYRLAPGSLAMIAIACLIAASASLVLIREYPAGGGAWLAVLWWLAFSAGLCADAAKQRIH